MDRTLEILLTRASALVLGVFAGKLEGDHPIVRVGGSGIFVAPFLAVTARHVSRDLLRLDWRGDNPGNRGLAPATGFFQFPNPLDENVHAIWMVQGRWDTRLTDLSIMQVCAFT